MKRIAAFFTAFALLILTAAGVHFFTDGNMDLNNREFGTWINSYKDMSYNALSQNMNDETMLVMGSSEFHHGVRGMFHPKAVFRDRDIDIMCLGAAYSQSLCHAVALGAMEPLLKNRKVVLILSPSWFTGQGVKPEAFSVRFSQSNYDAMMKNENLSDELKMRIAEKTEKYLVKDDKKRKAAELCRRINLEGSERFTEEAMYRIERIFDSERNNVTVLTALFSSEIKRNREVGEPGSEIDENFWEKMMNKAENYAEKRTTNNEFFMIDSRFNKSIKPVLGSSKNSNIGRSYGKSREYEDLEIFLEVCRETGIEPLILIQPVNGYWYDYTGFPKEGREAMRENVTRMAEKYGYKVADFFDEAYTPYFFEDAVHPGAKGWIMIDEAIYSFYHENQESC